MRLSVDGVLYMCLGQEESVELRPCCASGISDADLQQVLRQAIELKPGGMCLPARRAGGAHHGENRRLKSPGFSRMLAAPWFFAMTFP